jgi:hypothetical protein
MGVTSPSAVQAQTMDQLLRVMQEGGAWLALEIDEGRGSYTGVAVPTMGMNLQGFFQVADVHRGGWSIQVADLVRDPSGEPVIDVTVEPGERRQFAYDTGATVQVQVDVTWSEPADTVLWVWVGLPGGEVPAGRPGQAR